MKKSLCMLSLLVAAIASASHGTPPPSPPATGGSGGAALSRHDAREITFINDGTLMLFKKQWAAAQPQIEAAEEPEQFYGVSKKQLADVRPSPA